MSKTLTVVLLGNSGVGKSSTGNTLLGRTAFEPMTSCICEETAEVQGRRLSVVDTPGILLPDVQKNIREYCAEVLHHTRACLFLVVLRVGDVRGWMQQERAVEAVMEVLGEEGMKRSLLLFTFGDALKGQSLEEWISEDDKSQLSDIFTNMFRGRHHVIDNESWGQEQVKELLDKSDHLQRSLNPDVLLTAEAVVRPKIQTGAVSHQPLTLTSHLSTSPHQPLSLTSDPSTSPPTRITEIRLVLLGLPGAGRSSSGNTILGEDRFRTGCGFNSVSTEVICETAEVCGREVTVVDTPGFSDEGLKPKKLFKIIMKSVLKKVPNPHAFIIVVRLGRVNRRDTKLLKLMPKLFNKKASKFTMVLFTHGDDLQDENIQDLIEANSTMKALVDRCVGRYTVFNNRHTEESQVQELFQDIEKMVRDSGKKHYTTRVFRLTPDQIKTDFEDLGRKVRDYVTVET